MKNFLCYITVVFGIFTLSSCDPSQDANGDFLNGVDYTSSTGTTTKLLSKVSGVNSEGENTTMTYNYTSGKLISINSLVDDVKETTVLTYNGGIITHMEITNVDSGDTTLTKLDLLYSSGKLTSASGTTESDGILLYKSTTNVTYNAQKVSKVVTKMNVEDPSNPGQYILAFELTSDLTFAANNISLWKLTTSTVSIPSVVIETVLGSYDSNKNPFGTLPSAYNILSTHYSTSQQGATGLSTNNYKSLKVTALGTAQTVAVSYTYDESGYPKTMVYNNSDKLNFQYK
jgi:hypothetical protein